MTDRLKTFADFDVPEPICEALTDVGITTPFPIQELTLPLALSGADLIGQARTGTGKTLAFGIPLLARVDVARAVTQALVIVPTRELCLQVHDDLVAAGKRKGVRVVAAYGGKAIDPQSEAIARGAPIVVGTPGRLLDLRRRGLLDLAGVQNLVLDEADEMLDMGFLPDVEQLIEACGENRQTLLFSATMPSEVVALARRYMHKPTFMRADVEEPRIAPETSQYFFACHRMDKPAVVARILQSPSRGLCVIFTRTKRMADSLARQLVELGLNAAPLHSDLRQDARERALSRFRKGTVDVLCATEVAARGLDIEEVTHVFNYDCPDDEKMYLHRIGRTGRAGATGVAITLAEWNELARVEMIKKALDISAETHEVFSTSPLLAELFDLPEPAGRAARGQRGGQRPERDAVSRARPADRERPPARQDAGERPPAREDGGERPAARQDAGELLQAGERPRSREDAARERRPGTAADAGATRRVRRRRRTVETAQTEAPPTTESRRPKPAEDSPAVAATDEVPPAPERADRRRSEPDAATTRRRRIRRRSAADQPAETAGAATERPRRERSRPPARETEQRASTRDTERRARTRDPERPARPRDAERRVRAPARDAESRGRGRAPDRRSQVGGERTPDERAPSADGHVGGPAKEAPAVRAGGGPDPTDAARGDGKPALKRPMAITHLP